MTVIWYT